MAQRGQNHRTKPASGQQSRHKVLWSKITKTQFRALPVVRWAVQWYWRHPAIRLICVVAAVTVIVVATQPLQPFNGLFSRTTWVSRYQKGKTNLDFTGARDSEWQWHQLSHMQDCTSLQTDNHASTPPLCFLQAGCPSCRPTNSVKALKALVATGNNDNNDSNIDFSWFSAWPTVSRSHLSFHSQNVKFYFNLSFYQFLPSSNW